MRKILGPRGQVVAVEMTAAEWAKTHRDFKGRLEDGTRTVLTCDTAVAGGGSILAPVTIVKDSPQHNPRAARRRHQPGTRYRRAYDFFRQHAGGIVGESAKSAKALAEAESWARGRGVEFHWQDDPDADASFVETWPAKDQKRWNAEEHTVEGLVAIDPSTKAETSLWGIFDADNTYRRVLEAELALQLMPERRRVRPRAPAKRNPRGKTDGVTRDGIMWHIGGETIALSDGGNRKRYSGYTLAEALAEFRAEFPQENPRRKSRAETSVAYQKALGGRIRKVAASLGEHGRIIADVVSHALLSSKVTSITMGDARALTRALIHAGHKRTAAQWRTFLNQIGRAKPHRNFGGEFQKGQRVALHAATSEWMQGDRYGVVTGRGRARQYRSPSGVSTVRPYLVKLDRSGRTRRFHPENLEALEK